MAGLSFLIWLIQFVGPQAYNYLIAASGLGGFMEWLGIALTHYRFRRAYLKREYQLNDLPYRASLFPFGPIFAFILCIIVIVGQNVNAFVTWDWQSILITYMSVPLFFIFMFYYKLRHHSHPIPLDQVKLK